MESIDRRPLIRLNCAVCRRFLLKTAKPTGSENIPLLVVPCTNCKMVNYFSFDGDTLFHMTSKAKDAAEPEGDVTAKQLIVIKDRCLAIKLTALESVAVVL